MGLYHKQLNSVADLRREKKRLKIDRKVARKNAEAVEQAKEGSEEGNPLASFISMAGELLSSKSTKSALSGIAMPLFSMALGRAKHGFLQKAAKEVIGGYIKWKAIDYGVTLAMRFIRRQKNKVDNTADY
jgi:hypothetical protein